MKQAEAAYRGLRRRHRARLGRARLALADELQNERAGVTIKGRPDDVQKMLARG